MKGKELVDMPRISTGRFATMGTSCQNRSIEPTDECQLFLIDKCGPLYKGPTAEKEARAATFRRAQQTRIFLTRHNISLAGSIFQV